MKQKKTDRKTKTNKITAIKPNMSIITLTVDRLNILIR